MLKKCLLIDWQLFLLQQKISHLSYFQKWVNNSEGADTVNLQFLQGISTLFFICPCMFSVIWLLVEVQDCWGLLSMYPSWHWHGCDYKGQTSTTSTHAWKTLFGPTPHGSSCHCSYNGVTCRPSKSRGSCQGKLYLTSTLPDSLHSTQAKHSSLGGCNPPSPGLTNDSKNRKSER